MLDGWKEIPDLQGRVRRVRALPPRLVHVLAGNTPGVTGGTIARGALSKGVHLLKLPSNDLFTGTAILRTMAEVDPDHPVTQSFSCVYWRGGDPEVEGALFRAQYFDRLVAWGGDAAIRARSSTWRRASTSCPSTRRCRSRCSDARRSRRPKRCESRPRPRRPTAASTTRRSARRAGSSTPRASRTSLAQWCELLARELAIEREWSDAVVNNLPADIKAEVDVLRAMEPEYQVFGSDDGSGLVVLSDDPVDFHPSAKTVNVVRVPTLDDALAYVNVATQTIGLYPNDTRRRPARQARRPRDAASGAARRGHPGRVGFPHDGFYPLQRFMKWLVDDC